MLDRLNSTLFIFQNETSEHLLLSKSLIWLPSRSFYYSFSYMLWSISGLQGKGKDFKATMTEFTS